MEKSLTITIPDHWLIDTDPTLSWHLKEGIWIHKDHESILRVIAVYLELKDIPEALAELQKTHQDFMAKFAPKCIKWAETQKTFVLQKGTLKAMHLDTVPFVKADDNLLRAIFMPWVDKWALGSKAMFQWVVAISVLEGIRQAIGLNRQQLRKSSGKPSDHLLNFATQFDPELEWAWKLLLSGEYRRAEQAARRLARCTVQAKGFYRREEQALLVEARHWILVRIFNWTESKLDTKLNLERDLQSISRSLRLFDIALGFTRTPGAPFGKKHDGMDRAIEQVADILQRLDFDQ